jgi:hypothetical protein
VRPIDGTGTASVEAAPGRKTVPGPPHCGTKEEEGEETSGCENETRLVMAGPPGREPGGLPQRRRLPGVTSLAMQALRRLKVTTSSQKWFGSMLVF